MNRRLIFWLICCLLPSGTARGAPVMHQCLVSNGASAMNDAAMYLHASFGQPAIGISSDASTDAHHGFWFSPMLLSSAAPGQDLPIPSQLVLLAARPNPFATRTTLRFGLPRAADAKLVLYDVGGRQVATLFDGHAGAGYHTADVTARTLPCGVYFCRLESGTHARTARLVVMK